MFYIPLDTKQVILEMSQSIGLVLKKLNLTQRKQTIQEQNNKNTQKQA